MAKVNPANERMLGGAGADGAIHRAAGPELRTACFEVPEVHPGVRCPTGEAKITRGFKLPASHVIHTVGPVYDKGSNVAALLGNAYRNSLRAARENNIQYVAFPAISCGVFGYPFDEAATVAISTIKDHCIDIKEVHFVLFEDDIYDVWVQKAEELRMNMASNCGAHFNLSSTSALKILKGDIMQWFIDGSSDAIVNPANERMLGGGGADGAIHRATGPELRTACFEVPEVRPGVRCPTGEAKITQGFKLPASHVIHTVGPIYDKSSNVAALLSDAYRNSLHVARENNIQYVAFPAISCGVFGYPFDEAATVAISTIKEHCNDIKEVHFVLFADDIYNVWVQKAEELLPN